VYLTEEDIPRLAHFVGMPQGEFEGQYVYRTKNMRRFRKPRGAQCPFLQDNGCSVHAAKPEQCRTFPFWPEILEDEDEQRAVAAYCPGIG
jgi:Fe-S-cluster containining protein